MSSQEINTQPPQPPQAEEPHPFKEETPAPHLGPDGPEPELWSAVPLDPPSRALTPEEKWPGEWHLIAVMVAHGIPQGQIARELDYTQARISVILSKPAVQEKIERIRREESGNIGKRFAAVAPKALDIFENVISGREQAKTETRLDAARWVLEKHTGKPKQEITSDGGATIMQILQAIESIKKAEKETTDRNVIEVEVKEEAEDPMDTWIKKNITGQEKV